MVSKKFEVFFTPSSQKEYGAIRDAKLRRGINRVLEEIAEDPFQFKKLSGPLAHLRCAKTFSFRVLYRVEDHKLIVIVVSVHNRKDAYRF